MENINQHLNDPDTEAAELKERWRAGARATKNSLAEDEKAEVERRACRADVDRRYPSGVPINCRNLYDALAGDSSLATKKERLLQWDRLSAADVCDIYGRWPVDVNRVAVLNNDFAYAFGLANRAPTIRENIKKLLAELEHEEAEQKRLGPGDGLWTIPAMTPPAEPPVQVVTDFKTLKQ
jgi:hypothetical protein